MLEVATDALPGDPVKVVLSAVEETDKLCTREFGMDWKNRLQNHSERTQLGASPTTHMKMHIDHVANLYPWRRK